MNNNKPSSSAVTEKPCDASCLSVVRFNNTKPRTHSSIISYLLTPSDLPLRTITQCSAAVCTTLGGRSTDNTRWSEILVENRDFCIHRLHSMPLLRGFLLEYCHNVWHRRTRMVWLPEGKKKFEDMFIRFDRMHAQTWQTHGQTDTCMTAKAALA